MPRVYHNLQKVGITKVCPKNSSDNSKMIYKVFHGYYIGVA